MVYIRRIANTKANADHEDEEEWEGNPENARCLESTMV